MTNTNQLKKQYLWAALAILFILIAVISFAQDKSATPVKVKIVKIVDGDTSVIEKTIEESKMEDFTSQFRDIKGKNVQVMVTVDGADKKGKQASAKSSGKNNCASSMQFNFDMDSSTAHSFSKIFMFNDSMMGKNFTWNDSMMKDLPKDFNFNFNFDDAGEMNDFDFDINTDGDGKTVIIKSKDGKTIVINGEDADKSTSGSEKGTTKTKTRTMVISDDKTNTKKKIIVSTSVVVIDMDDDKGKSDKRKLKEENSFSFYPNPSDGNFMLDLDLSGQEDAAVRITDMNGKEVYNEKFSGNGKVSKTVNLSGKKGTFIVTIKQGKRTSSKKIIIE